MGSFTFVLMNEKVKNTFPNESKSVDSLLLAMLSPFERNVLAFFHVLHSLSFQSQSSQFCIISVGQF